MSGYDVSIKHKADTCPTCDAEINMVSPRFRGMLINEIARLGSETVTTKEQIAQLRNKRGRQLLESLVLVEKLETRLAEIEGRQAGLRFFGREFCGL